MSESIFKSKLGIFCLITFLGLALNAIFGVSRANAAYYIEKSPRLYRVEVSDGARDKYEAQSRTQSLCSNRPVGHAGYVENVRIREYVDDNGNPISATVEYDVTTIAKKCPGGQQTRQFAVVGGYGGGMPSDICPAAGNYGGIGGGLIAYDCIKFANPSDLLGSVYEPIWSRVHKGGPDQEPSSTGFTTNTFHFSEKIPNWGQVGRTSGSFTFINGEPLCSFYWLVHDPNDRSQDEYIQNNSCQYITATVYWRGIWTVNAETYIGKDGRNSDQSAKNRHKSPYTIQGMRPGQQLYWDHYIWNNGPDSIDPALTVHVDLQRNGDSRDIFSNSGYTGPKGALVYENHNERVDFSGGRELIGGDDAGTSICQRISWQPGSWSNSGWEATDYACAEVPYHYPSCDDPNDPDCIDWPYPSNPGGDCTFEGGCDDPNTDTTQAVTVDVTNDTDGTIMPGEDVTFSYNIRNDRGPTKTMGIGYKIYTFLYQGGHDVSSTKDLSRIYDLSYNAGCYGREVGDVEGSPYYVNVNGGDRCQQDGGGSGVVISSGGHHPDERSYTILDNWLGQPGDQICSYIVLDQYWNVYDNQPSKTQLASKISCVKIGKRPQIQINGSDSYANKGFTGSKYSDIELNYQRGSYSQYGLLTGSGSSSNFGSAGYTFSKSSNASKACQLGWANTSCNNSFSPGGLTHTFYNAVTVTDTTSYPGSLSSLSSPSGGGTSYYQASGGTNFSGNLNPGTRAVVYVNGDANITGNIIAYGAAGVSGNLPTNPDAGGSTNNLNQTFTNLVDIPSLTIVATGDININGSVTTIDANLVSKNGRVITCAGSDGGGTKTELGIGSTQCANKLKINGAVASKESPILHRIFGAGNTIDTTSNTNQWNNLMNSSSSEWFNYTPNVWLTPYLNGGGDTPNNYTTVQVTNLPARY